MLVLFFLLFYGDKSPQNLFFQIYIIYMKDKLIIYNFHVA